MKKCLSDKEIGEEYLRGAIVYPAMEELKRVLKMGSHLIQGEIDDLLSAIEDFPKPKAWEEWIEESREER